MSILFQVFVEGVEGRRSIIDVADKEQEFNNMTTDKFMEMVATKLLKKPGYQQFTLLYANQQMERGKKFSDYLIRNKSTFVMVIQLPGGGGDMLT
ncbi:hypothetical protein KIL84_006961 [Mauremys mutica]|uniref:Uncharacterized protein n=1 Tax=Mauremys mutica TaxID=74926 RepID=A0A9D4AUL8_9SAUR|nr:hypothetical protein KIL84_006961 [Mauremys mutica]